MNDDPYRNVAGIYDRIFEPINKGLRSLGARMLPPEQGMQVLDIGCGTGVHLDLYKKYGCKLYGVDTSPAMLGMAKQRLGDSADLRLGDATSIPFEDNSFDLVLCMLVLHEMDQATRLAVIAEMKRVIKADGHILLIDFHAGPARLLKGWFIKPFIFVSELAAGRRHFRNYRHFISIRGLPTLIEQNGLKQKESKIVAGGAMALHLVQAN